MKMSHYTSLLLLLCLIVLPRLGFAGNDFLTDPATAQGYLVWKKSTQTNATYQIRLTEKDRRGRVVQVTNMPAQAENYYHFDNVMRSNGRRWTAQVRTLVNGSAAYLTDIIDIGPLPELDDDVFSELQCTWVCPGMGYQIDAYCMHNGNGNCYGYVMELMSSQQPYYQYMYYSTWQNSGFYPFIDGYHVIDLGGVDYSDGYCHDGTALDGHVVGVLIENPYGIIQTNLMTGNSPCVLASGVNQAGLIIENNCAYCDPGTVIDCNVSGDCVGGGWSSTSGTNGQTPPVVYDHIDSLFFSWIYDEELDGLDDPGDIDKGDYIQHLIGYEEVAQSISGFDHVAFERSDLRSTVDQITLYRLDDPTAAPTHYDIRTLDAQNRGDMAFEIDMSRQSAGVYSLFVRLQNGHHMRSIFAHTPRTGRTPSRKTDLLATAETMLELYPNPASEQLTARISNGLGNTHLQILDLNGRVQLDQNVEVLSAEQEVQLSIQTLPAGLYFLRLESNGQSQVQKFLVQ